MDDQIVIGLKKFYRSSNVAQAFFDLIAQRKNDQQEMTVERAIDSLGNYFDRREVVDLFKRLQGLGCGTFVLGRHTRRSRFVWGVSMISVGRAAKGEISEVEEITEVDEEEIGPEVIVHTYHIRPDFPIEMALPVDLTQREADRLAMFFKSLSFEPDL